ncbi:UNVERIFIED_CONTAM: 60S ribosomal protein L2, mitochondrial [Sesamum latifolium]|uniref:60S ribosomal protein L2, mitochondrial n=1 Tax=Sesamum latifolium TaxID=2727402 RepID=A0AAW2S1K0_9LAMI
MERGGHQRKCNTIEEFAPPKKRLESTTTTIRGPFAFSSLPGKVDQRKVACISPLMAFYVVVGLPTRMPSWSKSHFTSKGAGSKKNLREGRFLLCLLLSKGQGRDCIPSFGSSFGFPRIAVAGAKPAFFVFRMREKVRGKNTFSLCEIRKWRTHSILWAHRIKRKAALSWQSFRRQEILGLVGASEHNESKPKTDQGFYTKAIDEGPKNGTCKVDRAPVTYIIASHQLEAGKMVMNWSKPSTSDLLRPAQNANTY